MAAAATAASTAAAPTVATFADAHTHDVEDVIHHRRPRAGPAPLPLEGGEWPEEVATTGAAAAAAATKALDIHLQLETIQAENNFLATHLGGTAPQGQVAGALPAWYVTWEAFFRKYMRTFVSGEGVAGQAVLFAGDKEFFRAPVPKNEEVLADGLPSDMEAKKFTSLDSITSVRPSILKGLGPRETRLKASEPPVRVESGEEGVMVNQLLFPLSA
jgi:hypothetical protein